jgi:hypothetical protein
MTRSYELFISSACRNGIFPAPDEFARTVILGRMEIRAAQEHISLWRLRIVSPARLTR